MPSTLTARQGPKMNAPGLGMSVSQADKEGRQRGDRRTM